jgi:hypothetical protein
MAVLDSTTGHLDSDVLAWLHRESALITPGDHAALIKAEVPPELADDLSTAISQATDPADDSQATDAESST